MSVKNLVLASQSAARKNILENLNIQFSSVSLNIDEQISHGSSPENNVTGLSAQKMDFYTGTYGDTPDDLVMTADTLIYFEGKLIGKPKDRDDAFKILKSFSGNTHQIYTGFTLRHKNKIVTDYSVTTVKFYDVSEICIKKYIETDEPFGKAGAYEIQGLASAFIEKIDGDFYNVAGLPVSKIFYILQTEYNITLFDLRIERA